MSAKERLRLRVLEQVASGSLSLSQGALNLGVSYRQMRRIRHRRRVEGDEGLLHRLRGKASNRKSEGALREKVLFSYREKYEGFGPTLAAEYLAKDEDVQVSHDTLRRWLLAEGLMPKRRRGRQHRSRRERRSRLGALVQMDGSHHDWLEGRGAWLCLMVMIDDATGRVYARFYEKETLVAAFDVFGRYAKEHGVPVSLYVDRAGIYRSDKEPTLEQELANEKPLTQFGRAMKSLEVELILANSPQAKGRVERMNSTLQDRLVKAMRLAGISDMGAANRLLDESFLGEFNKRFMVPAAEAGDVHRQTHLELSDVLCEHHERKVGRDWCVQWHGTLLQIDKEHQALGLSGKTVMVRAHVDKGPEVLWQGRPLSWIALKQRPARVREKPLIVNNKEWKPGLSHPWRTERLSARASSPAAPPPLPTDQNQRTVLLR